MNTRKIRAGFLSIRGWLLFALLFAFPARASVSLSALADRRFANPGDTINVSAFVNVEAGDAFTGGSIYLRIPTSGSVTLTGADYGGSVVFLPYTPAGQPALSDFNTSYDLGGDIANIDVPLRAGRYLLGKFALRMDAYVPILRVELDGGDGYYRDAGVIAWPYGHADGTEIIERSSGGVVPAVPEPTVLELGSLLLLAWLALSRCLRRRGPRMQPGDPRGPRAQHSASSAAAA